MEKVICFDNKIAKLFISQQAGGEFISSVLYYKKTGDWSKGTEIVMDFNVESFVSDSEKGAQEKAEQWFSKNVAEVYTIK